MAWMRARISPACRASSGRTVARASSRRILRGIVSPDTRSMMKPDPSPSSGPSTCNTVGEGTPAAPAARMSAASISRPSRIGASTLADWRRMINGRSMPGPLARNDQDSRLAPPDKSAISVACSVPGTIRLAQLRSASSNVLAWTVTVGAEGLRCFVERIRANCMWRQSGSPVSWYVIAPECSISREAYR